MVLDLDLFREDKGSNLEKVRENQRKRFKDVALVDAVIDKDKCWRQLRHRADNLNKSKNVCSKEIGERMKKKEAAPGDAEGEDETLSNNITENLDNITLDKLKTQSVSRIKKIRALIDDAIVTNGEDLLRIEFERNSALREVGNHLDVTVPVSNDEDENKVGAAHFSYLSSFDRSILSWAHRLVAFSNFGRSKERSAIASNEKNTRTWTSFA